VEEHYAEESTAALAPCREALDRRGILYDAHALVGDPAPEIVAYARDHRYDCIALGVHGHNVLANLMLGSVAQKVVAEAGVPVLLLK
jgi:nucleotide-binding universal stress UspA family protein